jgi:dynein heavy chain
VLKEYEKLYLKAPNLVLLETVMQRIIYIVRLLTVCRSHGLLIGLGGDGRSTSTRLAALLADWNCFGVRAQKRFGPAEWRENMKRLYKLAGNDPRNTVFLCSDDLFEGKEQVDDALVEDINILLRAEELPNLFSPKEKEAILTERKTKNLDDFFQNVRSRLLVILCFNPSSGVFRK